MQENVNSEIGNSMFINPKSIDEVNMSLLERYDPEEMTLVEYNGKLYDSVAGVGIEILLNATKFIYDQENDDAGDSIRDLFYLYGVENLDVNEVIQAFAVMNSLHQVFEEIRDENWSRIDWPTN